MKATFSITSLVLSAILFLGCESTTRAYVDGATVITFSSVEEKLQDTTCFKTPKIISLETTDVSLIANIKRISTDGDFLFIFDSQQMKILIFDMNGKYINQIYKVGQGPGEYDQFQDFSVDAINKEIILSCDRPYKIMYFSYNGELIKEEYKQEYYRYMALDDNYLCLSNSDDMDADKFQLTIVDRKTNTQEEGLPNISGIKNFAYVSGAPLTKGATNIHYTRRFDNSIYKISNGDIIKKYDVDFKEFQVPDHFKGIDDSGKLLDDCTEHNYTFSMTNVVESDRFMMFNTGIGMCLYDKQLDILKGYEWIADNRLNSLIHRFYPLQNSDKIVCQIDPIYIGRGERFEKIYKDDPELLEISKNLTEDSNPILIIYEFKE